MVVAGIRQEGGPDVAQGSDRPKAAKFVRDLVNDDPNVKRVHLTPQSFSQGNSDMAARYKAQFWGLQAHLLDTPATSRGGVLAKLRGFYNDAEIADIRTGGDPDDPLPEKYAASIYRDLERLAGEARS